MNARVVNNTDMSDCIIEWEHDDNDLMSLKYLVKCVQNNNARQIKF